MIRRNLKTVVAAALAALIAGCGGALASGNAAEDLYAKVVQHAEQQAGKAYIPRNNTEFRNYNDAQKLYDSPTSIIYCTTTWGNASAPLVTVPIAGKLTSSTTSVFSPEDQKEYGDTGALNVPRRSVDGMYHPNPPQYRYGFTPGGQYVDFFNMPTLCTTALTKFQRQATKVSVTVDATARAADQAAQAALARGDKAGAQRALDALEGGNG